MQQQPSVTTPKNNNAKPANPDDQLRSAMMPASAYGPAPTAQTPTKRQKRRKKKATDEKTQDETATVTAADDEDEDALNAQLKLELAVGPPFTKISFEFSYENGEYLGLKLLPTLQVAEVDQRPSISPFWDKIYPGDVFRALNGRPIKSLDSFYQAIRRLQSPINLTLERPVRLKAVTENRLKRLNVNPATTADRYLTAYVFYRPQSKLGLSVKAYKNMVALLKVESDGLGAGAFEVGDLILDVDGVPVKETEETKQRMLSALKARKFVSVVIMRPMTGKSLETTRQILGSAAVCEDDPEMKMDAVLIGRTEAMRRKIDKARAVPKKGILVKPTTHRAKQSSKPRLSIDAKSNREIEIWTDVDASDFHELESVPGSAENEEVKQSVSGTSSTSSTSNTTFSPLKNKRVQKIKKFLLTRFNSL